MKNLRCQRRMYALVNYVAKIDSVGEVVKGKIIDPGQSRGLIPSLSGKGLPNKGLSREPFKQYNEFIDYFKC